MPPLGYLLEICSLFVVVLGQVPCKTPDQRSGQCVNIYSCAPYLQLLKNPPLSQPNLVLLRQSACGFDGTNPKVCCPSSPTTTNDKAGLKFLPSKDICGHQAGDRIVGGTATELDEFPWLALLFYDHNTGYRDYLCGGSLISNRYVLTAAHCLTGAALRNWRFAGIRLGEYDLNNATDCFEHPYSDPECADPPIDFEVEEKIIHESYNPTSPSKYNDIALLRLSKPVTYTDFIQPICLPTTDDDLREILTGRNATVAGWGATDYASSSNVKLKVNVPVKPNEECTRSYSRQRVNLLDTQLCAGGERGRDSCRGDSGGPLMTPQNDGKGGLRWYAVGVVSFGPLPCGIENMPGVYTNVGAHREWILSKLRA